MIISSGIMQVLKNGNKSAKFFKDISVGDEIEIMVNLDARITYGVSGKLVTVHNRTTGEKRTDAPTYINKGLDRLLLQPVLNLDEAEYQRGYQDAYNELQDAYIGGYIEDMFEDEEGEE